MRIFRKTTFVALAFALVLCCAALGQDVAIPIGPGLGVTVGEPGGDWTVGLDLTSPYLRIPTVMGSGFLAFRAGADVALKQGIPLGGTTESWQGPAYYAVRAGLLGGGAWPNNYFRLYGEVGGVAVFPTSSVASSLIPRFGFYGKFGVEFFQDEKKQHCLFIEVGEQLVFGAGADNLVGAPSMGHGPTVTAGYRIYLGPSR
jgi:hypothetical protein